MSGDHGHCPKCNADLNGGSIWQHFYDQALDGKHYKQAGVMPEPGEAEKLADASASMYGATRTEGQWGREIGIYDREKDRTVEYQCPDCGHTWPR